MLRLVRHYNKLPFVRHYSMMKGSFFVGIFGLVGVGLLFATHAATPISNAIEPESGNVTSGADMLGDTSASGGGYIAFAASAPAAVGGILSTSCKYYSTTNVTPAFCATFDSPYTGAKTQTGDLDPILWGVSRMGTLGTPNLVTPTHSACDGGGTTGDPITGDPNSTYFGPAKAPPDDARICNAHYVESLNDGGSMVDIDTYPKQPFDFTNRTGRVVFDVTNDGTGSHGAWPEFIITDEPVPGTRSCESFCPANTVHATNMVGFAMADGHDNTPKDQIGVNKIFYASNGGNTVEIHNSNFNEGSISKGCLAGHSYQCPTTKFNHYEVEISRTRIDIYGTDAGSTTLKHLDGADLNLGFTSGLVWMNDMHYNARKAVEPCGCGTQYDHSFAWDNLGFDGPKTYRDLGYDVPLANIPGFTNQNGDSNAVAEGYDISGTKSFSIPNVSWQAATPKSAKVVLNAEANNATATLKVVLNGHTADAVTKSMPAENYNTFGPVWGTFSFVFPAADAVQGTNKLDISSSDGSMQTANISLIIVAGAPVP